MDGEHVYVANTIGCRVTVALPPAGSGPMFVYEVKQLAVDEAPAVLDFVEQAR